MTAAVALSRDCAAPMTIFRVAKEDTDGITLDERRSQLP